LWGCLPRRIVVLVVERKDVEAALEARRELGPGYEPEIVDQLVEKIERRLDERSKRAGPPEPQHAGPITPLALGSLGCGIAATAIATGNHQGWVAVIAWIAIALVNVAYARAWRR
jgi:hypothetical protein